MKITELDICDLQIQLGRDVQILESNGDIVRVKYPDNTFSFWKLGDNGFFRIGLRTYNPNTHTSYKQYSFPLLSELTDGVCKMVVREKIRGSETEYSYGKYELNVYYATIKNNEFVCSCKFKNVNQFKSGMGCVENFNHGNGGTYSYVTLDENKNFVYLPQEYSNASDYDGEYAHVFTLNQQISQIIDKKGNVIQKNKSSENTKLM